MITKLICIGSVCAQLSGMPTDAVVRGQRNALPIFDEINLASECEKMNSIGQIKDLLDQLDFYATEISKITLKNPSSEVTKVKELEIKIDQITNSAKKILAPEWTANKWPYEVNWILKPNDLLDVPDEINAAFF